MVCSVRTDNGWQLFDMIWRCCNAVGDFFANSRCECSASPRAVYRTAVPDSDTWAWNCKLAHPEMKIVLPCELHMCVASEILAGKKTEDRCCLRMKMVAEFHKAWWIHDCTAPCDLATNLIDTTKCGTMRRQKRVHKSVWQPKTKIRILKNTKLYTIYILYIYMAAEINTNGSPLKFPSKTSRLLQFDFGLPIVVLNRVG